MTSKKKSNTAFGATFGWGMFFISIVIVILSFFVAGIVNYLLPDNKRVSDQNQMEVVEKKIESDDVKQTDTVYITKTVVEKCTKKHCIDEISTTPSPIEEDKQHDSTNN